MGSLDVYRTRHCATTSSASPAPRVSRIGATGHASECELHSETAPRLKRAFWQSQQPRALVLYVKLNGTRFIFPPRAVVVRWKDSISFVRMFFDEFRRKTLNFCIFCVHMTLEN